MLAGRSGGRTAGLSPHHGVFRIVRYERTHGHLKHARDVDQAAAGNAVRCGLVFLHLLKSDAYLLAERGLRRPPPRPMEADVASPCRR
jgi:hypothetical protein